MRGGGVVRAHECTDDGVKQGMADFVRKLCKCEKTGACVYKRADALVVTNIGIWPQSFTDGLQSRFPSAAITISECDVSTSHFKVVISYGHHGRGVYNLLRLLLFFVCMLAFVALNLHYTFHRHFIQPSPWINGMPEEPSSQVDSGTASEFLE